MTPREAIPAAIPEEIEMEVENALKSLVEGAAPKKNTIRVTREEIEIEMAKDLGLTIQEYARGKAQLLKAQAEYEAWLQTPAGAKHMVKLEAERQRKLKRDREYSRAYRARKALEKKDA
jgi:hypothetical protein